MNMKLYSAKTLPGLTIIALALSLFSMNAGAFIDERTPVPPPAPVAEPVAAPAVQVTAPVTAPAAPALSGSFPELAWLGAFQPENLGTTDLSSDHKVPLADAILTISPAQAGTLRLDGNPELLTRRVQVQPAATRKAALELVARNAEVSISRTGDALMISQISQNSRAATPAPAANPAAIFGTAQKTIWAIRPEDGTVRQTLVRWAKTAGWSFSSNLWTVPVDIPVIASATFNGEFKKAVQDLMAATELGDTPVQACFYENMVIRVVPVTERCDRTGAE